MSPAPIEVEQVAWLECCDERGSYLRTDGLSRSLHPELAVTGLDRATAEALLCAVLEQIGRGVYLELPGGNWVWQGMSYTYEWQPDRFFYWFERKRHP
jgi:hypothetical protein